MPYNLRLCHSGCDRLIFQLATRPLLTRSERVAAAARKEKQARPCTHTGNLQLALCTRSREYIVCWIYGAAIAKQFSSALNPLHDTIFAAARIAKVCLNGQTLLVIKVMG